MRYAILYIVIVTILISSNFGSCYTYDYSTVALRCGTSNLYEETDNDGAISSCSNSRSNEPVTFTNVAHSIGFYNVSGGFFTWGDYNNDGYEDLLIGGSRLFKNNGPPGWNFTEVTNDAGISSGGGVWADYDNDGWLDTFGSKLWHNNGNGTFTDVTATALPGYDSGYVSAAGWGDYNKDGWIDLYIARGEDWNDGNPIWYPDDLWRNNGDGTFTDVTSSSGIRNYGGPYYGRSVSWADFDNDGWLDVYVGNYRLCPNFLFRNNHDGSFTDVAPEKNCMGNPKYHEWYGGPYYGHTIGTAWADFNNDGYLDIMVSNLAHKVDTADNKIGYICDDSNLYMNLGPPEYNFTDVRADSGIPITPVGTTAPSDGYYYFKDELFSNAAWGDYDNDGDLDLFIPQVYSLEFAYSFLYRNNGDGTFTDVAEELGLRVWDTYGGAWCDYDNDGFLDLITGGKVPHNGDPEVHFFRNNGNSNNWLKIKVEGTESNFAGIGTRIKLTCDGEFQIRQVEGGMGSHSQQNSLTIEFGIGSHSVIDELEVIWPSGNTLILEDVLVNQLIEAVEGAGAPVITSLSISNSEVDEDEEVTFIGIAEDPDGSIETYQWDFEGDGTFDWNSSSSGTTTHSYPKAGIYYPKFRVIDDTGYATTESTEITVNNVPPVANAGEDMGADEDEELMFDATGTEDTPSDKVKLMYKWDFGDGTTTDWCTEPTTTHVYELCGTYTVQLDVKDDDGITDTDLITVVVTNVYPICDAGPDQVVDEDYVVYFSGYGNDTPSDAPTLLYSWDFGDGTETDWQSSSSATHVYGLAGSFIVTLFVKDDDNAISQDDLIVEVLNVPPYVNLIDELSGLEDEVIYFDGSNYTDTPGDLDTLNFTWDFDDGTYAYAVSTTHVYTDAGTYNVKLTVRDNDNVEAVDTIIVTIQNVVPVAYAGENQTGDEDEELAFTGIGEDTISDLASLLYKWDFGDGSNTSWQKSGNVTHRFVAEGTYEVTLLVKDDNNAIDENTITVVIENVVPKAVVASADIIADEDELITFDASASIDTPSDRETLNFSWDFGNDNYRYGEIVNYSYPNAGVYEVTLTVQDDDLAKSRRRIRVSINNVVPVAKIEPSGKIKVRVGETIRFDGSGSFDTPSDLATLRYSWDFGDGSADTGKRTTHKYRKPGTYTVVLTVTDDDLARNYCSVEVEVVAAKETWTRIFTAPTLENGGVFLYAGIVGGAVMLIVLMTVFRRRRRKRQDDAIKLQGVPSAETPYETPRSFGIGVYPQQPSAMPGYQYKDYEQTGPYQPLREHYQEPYPIEPQTYTPSPEQQTQLETAPAEHAPKLDETPPEKNRNELDQKSDDGKKISKSEIDELFAPF